MQKAPSSCTDKDPWPLPRHGHRFPVMAGLDPRLSGKGFAWLMLFHSSTN
jgi:hypothetical protein